MTPGPGDELTPSAGGRGHLRASHADRERVVDFLKAAFVQGRLTKEELEQRAGQALGSWTYAELAELTADLPGGPMTAPPPPTSGQARDRARLPVGKIVLVGTGVLTAPAVLAAAIITGNEGLARAFDLIFPFYFTGWLAAMMQILDNVRKRPRGQLPPRPALPEGALEGEQDGATGDGPMLAEARANAVPGRHGGTPSPRSLPVRPARRGAWTCGTPPEPGQPASHCTHAPCPSVYANGVSPSRISKNGPPGQGGAEMPGTTPGASLDSQTARSPRTVSMNRPRFSGVT